MNKPDCRYVFQAWQSAFSDHRRQFDEPAVSKILALSDHVVAVLVQDAETLLNGKMCRGRDDAFQDTSE